MCTKIDFTIININEHIRHCVYFSIGHKRTTMVQKCSNVMSYDELNILE